MKNGKALGGAGDLTRGECPYSVADETSGGWGDTLLPHPHFTLSPPVRSDSEVFGSKMTDQGIKVRMG